MKIKFFAYSLFLACLPFTLKPAAQPLESTAKLPASYGSMASQPRQHSFGATLHPTSIQTTLPRQHSFGSTALYRPSSPFHPSSPTHPALGDPAIAGRPYLIPCRPESAEINSDTNETKVEVVFEKLDYDYIVETIGKIPDTTKNTPIINMLKESPNLQNLTPYLIEISNSDDTTIKFDYNRFCFDYRDLLGEGNLAYALKFQWGQVWSNTWRFILNITGIAAVIGVDTILLQFAANKSGDESADDKSYITSFTEALTNILVHLVSLGTAGFFVKNIAQRWSLIKARTQVQNEVSKYELPYEMPQEGLSPDEIPFLVERGGAKRFLVLVKTIQCHEFEHEISTNTLNEYVAAYIENPIEEDV